MARLSRTERRTAVLLAAADRVRALDVDWAASLTFSQLANDTDIDQAQIARDFGSKEELVAELMKFLVDPSQLPDYAGHTTEWIFGEHSLDQSLGELLAGWAKANDALHESHADLWRAEMLIWAVTEVGTPTWHQIADSHRSDVESNAALFETLFSGVSERASGGQGDLSVQEAVSIMRCFIMGAIVARGLVPDLLGDDLSSKLVQILGAAVLGAEEPGPIEQLSRIHLSPQAAEEPDR